MICDWASGVCNGNVVVSKQTHPLDISVMLLAVCEKGRVSEVGLSVDEQSQVALLALSLLACWYTENVDGFHLLIFRPS